MNRMIVLGISVLSVAVCPAAHGFGSRDDDRATQQATEQAAPASRAFRFDYAAELRGVAAGTPVRVWLPVPPSNEHQRVVILEGDLPAPAKTSTEPKYGNRILYFESTIPADGPLAFRRSYQVTRHEVRGLGGSAAATRRLTDREKNRFLAANERVPVSGKPLQLLEDVDLPREELSMARLLYDRVDEHVRYDKSRPGYGRGDVLWVCDSRFGNCTDFHSLFISLARSQGLPARFEIGFPLPPERGEGAVGGYHCWAFFHHASHGWVPVDISEADKHPDMKQYYFGNLTENRVTFSVGRDIDLVPQQAAPPLNFFVYPHVEVRGKSVPKDQLQLEFRFTDDS